jgi:hypothetical protein
MESYSDLTVDKKNHIAKFFDKNLKNHIPKLKDYQYFMNSSGELIILDGTKIIGKNIKTTSFIQSIPSYERLQPTVTKDDLELWSEASFIVNNTKMSILNEDLKTNDPIFPLKYSDDDSFVRSYNKKILRKYCRKDTGFTLGKQGNKIIDSMIPGIGGVNKNEVYNKVNHILKGITDPTDINAIMKAAKSKRFIK